jgi:RNA polymerase sigma factor (sigma-70 family)
VASSQTSLVTLFQVGSFAGLMDGALLERFIGSPPDTAEAAFTALVERHGAMVRRTCRQVTRDYHDAEDAAQATFLVLARSARSLRSSDSLAAWLHGVAYRVSTRMNADAARRRARERRAAELAAAASHQLEPWPEIHEEISRLPDRYRLPIVLCHLQGLSYTQAAHRLGCRIRTLQTRLARGRARLRSRLVRRGLGPVASSMIARVAPESASTAWAQATARLAVPWITKGGSATTGSVPVAMVLAREVLRAMTIQKLKIALSLVLLTTVAGAGVWGSTGLGLAPPILARSVRAEVTIKGWVTGPDGKPLAKASVRSPMLRMFKIREDVVTTGPEGEFTITAEELPHDAFPLRVDAPDLAPRVFTIWRAPRPGDPISAPLLDPSILARRAYLAESSGEISPALSLDRGGTVTGRIVRDGKPVPGASVGLSGFENFLDVPEVKAGADGRFRFPHVPTDVPCWVFVTAGSLERSGAVRPRSLQTPDDEASIDVGDMAVEPGRSVAGRVVFSDGKSLPANAEVLVSADHGAGLLRAKPDRSGRFRVAGLPAGEVAVCVHFPDDQFYAPAGYRISPRNKCVDPLNPWRLIGRADRDVADLTILFEPGEQQPGGSQADITAASKDALAGPITGVPPDRDE